MKWAIFSALFALCIFVVPTQTHAATLYIDPNQPTAFRADSVTLAVRIDTDTDECINTIDAVINYDPTISAVDISLGSSIFTLWPDEPKIDETKHQITLAGGIPNGYCGRIPGDPQLTNIVAEIVFLVPGFTVGGVTGDRANITFDPLTQVLLNDGLGTAASLRTFGATVELKNTAGDAIVDDWQNVVSADKTAPEEFSINLIQEPNVFSGKYYIAWSTTDKQTGIDHYEVYEEPIKDLELFHWGEADRVWTKVKSPYVLKDQFLRSVIRVKAIDKAGNERLAMYAPDKSQIQINPMYVVLYTAIGVCGLILLCLLLYFIVRSVRSRRAIEVVHHDENTTL